jgi:hypothetical protein
MCYFDRRLIFAGIGVGSYDARIDNQRRVNDCGNFKINIPPPLNHKTKIMHFYKSEQINVMLVKNVSNQNL